MKLVSQGIINVDQLKEGEPKSQMIGSFKEIDTPSNYSKKSPL